jgi:predicted outer membrane protein
MRHNRKIAAPVLLVLALLLAGCAAQNPSTVPTPPPIQVASATNALAQALKSSVQPLIAAREAGSISEADLQVAFSIMETMGVGVKKINAELASTDPWEVQKLKILTIVSSAGLPYFAAKLPPNARLIILVAITTWNSIAVQVGGPTL